MTPTQAWRVLGISKTADVGAIRRAYATQLKAMDVDRDVDGYARLREAREAGLRWARMHADLPAAQGTDKPIPASLPASEDAPLPAPAESSSWLYAAPAAHGEADPNLTTRLAEIPAGGGSHPLDVTPGFVQASAPAHHAIGLQRDPFTRPVLLGLEQNADAVMPTWAHEQALHRLLLPDSDADEYPPLEGWEEATARGHLRAILHNAETLSVTAFSDIDNWIAGLLSRAWPRSSPLLEPAAEAFRWESERGQVNERPDVAFLNARLRGLRFAAKVQEPRHPLHKAWTELTTPAQQGSRRGWLVKRRDIEQLLEGVRKNFPELEHHFDPWRVTLWEREGTSSGNHAWLSNGRLIAIALIFMIQIVRFAMSSNDPDPQAIASPPTLSASEQAIDREVIERAVTDIFGGGLRFEDVQSRQPDLAALFAANRTVARSQQDTPDVYVAALRNQVRERMYMSALASKGPALEGVQRIRVEILRAARKVGPAQCMDYIRNRRLDPKVALSPSLLARESALARQMLDDRQLGPPARQSASRVSISGRIVGQVIDATGIDEARVRDAMNGRGTDADQCAVALALLDAALAWNGADRQAILSVL